VTKYELYLCDVSGKNEPIAKIESISQFNSFSIEDRFDDHGWNRLNGIGKIASATDPKRYIIHSIKHTIYYDKDDLLIQCWLNLEPHQGETSPAWKQQ